MKYCDSLIVNIDDIVYLFDIYSYKTIRISRQEYDLFEEVLNNPEKLYSLYTSSDFRKNILPEILNGNFFRKVKIGNIKYDELFKQTPILSFTPVHNCNLSCIYCYANSGLNYKDHIKITDKDIICKTLNFFDYMFKNTKKIKIEFVGGGEPLLHFKSLKNIISVLKEFCDNKSYLYKIQLITNGTLLNNRIINWIDSNQINLGISLDGNSEIQNVQRPFRNGMQTYNIIYENIKTILNDKYVSNHTKSIWGVVVLTTKVDDIHKVIEHHHSIGIRSLEIRIARGKENSNDVLLNKSTLNHFKQLYYKLVNDFIDDINNGNYNLLLSIINNYDTFGKILKRLINSERVLYRCGAGKWKFACTASGEIYPCDSFVGNKKYLIANINDSYLNQKLIDEFYNTNVQTIANCTTCGFRYLCGGDCYYNSLLNCNSINNTKTCFCELNKYLCSLAIHLVYEMKKNDEKYYKIKSIVHAREIINR